MTRFHVHLNVADLATSVNFYRGLFGAEPSLVRDDYAKWMLDDPRLNFAISTKGRTPGIDHVGFQVDDADGLARIGARLAAAEAAVLPEAGATCCYARSDKLWTEDPQGLRWESVPTHGEATSYYAAGAEACANGAACAAPEAVVPVAAAADKAARKAACCGADSACC